MCEIQGKLVQRVCVSEVMRFTGANRYCDYKIRGLRFLKTFVNVFLKRKEKEVADKGNEEPLVTTICWGNDYGLRVFESISFIQVHVVDAEVKYQNRPDKGDDVVDHQNLQDTSPCAVAVTLFFSQLLLILFVFLGLGEISEFRDSFLL